MQFSVAFAACFITFLDQRFGVAYTEPISLTWDWSYPPSPNLIELGLEACRRGTLTTDVMDVAGGRMKNYPTRDDFKTAIFILLINLPSGQDLSGIPLSCSVWLGWVCWRAGILWSLFIHGWLLGWVERTKRWGPGAAGHLFIFMWSFCSSLAWQPHTTRWSSSRIVLWGEVRRCFVASYGLSSDVVQYHFHHVLLVQAVAGVYSAPWEGNTEYSARPRSTKFSFVVKTQGMGCIAVAVFGKYNLLHVLTVLLLNGLIQGLSSLLSPFIHIVWFMNLQMLKRLNSF